MQCSCISMPTDARKGGRAMASLKLWQPNWARAISSMFSTPPLAALSLLTCAANSAGHQVRFLRGRTFLGHALDGGHLPQPGWPGCGYREASTPIRGTKEANCSSLGCRCRRGKPPRERVEPPLWSVCEQLFTCNRDRNCLGRLVWGPAVAIRCATGVACRLPAVLVLYSFRLAGGFIAGQPRD